MWRYVDLVWTDVSEERIASIRVENKQARNQREQVAADWDRGDTFLRNIGWHKIYTAPYSENELKFRLYF
jgi:hypothetical protein